MLGVASVNDILMVTVCGYGPLSMFGTDVSGSDIHIVLTS